MLGAVTQGVEGRGHRTVGSAEALDAGLVEVLRYRLVVSAVVVRRAVAQDGEERVPACMRNCKFGSLVYP